MLSRGVKLAFAVLSVTSLLCGTGCGGGSGTAELRVMNASPDESNLDVLVDGKIMAGNLAYGANTGYLKLSPGSHQVQLNASGTSKTVLSQGVNLPGQTTCTTSAGSTSSSTCASETTVIAYNYAASIAALVLSDNNSIPSSGDVQLRFVNAAPSIGTDVDVYAVAPGTDLSTVAPTVAGLGFGTASDYQSLGLTVTQTAYQVFFTTAGTRSALIDTGAISLSSGQIKTIVALNNPAGGFTFSILADLN